MTETNPIAYHRIVLDNQRQFESLIRHGEKKPVFLWHICLLLPLLLLALLVPHRQGARYVRPALFAVILGITMELIYARRMILGGNGYMTGVVGTWWLLWCATLLLFNDPERDFMRIERHSGREPTSKQALAPKLISRCTETFCWQSYPASLSHRLNWTLGLVLNLRGPEWNWRVSTLDPLPSHLELNRKKPNNITASPPYPDAKRRLRTAITRFIVAYLAIDILKFIFIRDPYFTSAASHLPAPFPFNHLSTIPGSTRLYRLATSGVAIFFALQYVTALNPLIFLGLSLAFPNASHKLTSVPLDAPWLYPDTFGPFLSSILDNGLAGVWSQWWHQLFRFGFLSTAKWVLTVVAHPPSSARKTSRPRPAQLQRISITLIGFGLSGLIHACGSYTQLADTHPVRGTFLFFILQAVGIIGQDLWCRRVTVTPRLLRPFRSAPPPPSSDSESNSSSQYPRWLRRTGNGMFVLFWLLLTGGLMADELARGKLWLTEPLPVSFIRGFRGDGWWCWQGPWFEYYDDGTFWGRGWRIL